MNREKIRHYVKLGYQCMANKEENLLRYWLLTRHSIQNTSGWISIESFLNLLGELGLKRKYARQILYKGENTNWWGIADGRVWFTSIKKLEGRLGITSDQVVYLERDALRSIKIFRAFIYASIFAKDSSKEFTISQKGIMYAGGKIISRETLSKLTNKKRQTQIKYEEIASIKKEPTFAYFKMEDAEFFPLRDGDVYYQRGQWWEDVDGDGNQELISQLPNRYSVNLDYAGRRKFRRNKEGISYCHDTGRYSRIYYENRIASYKALSRGKLRGGVYSLVHFTKRKHGKTRRFYKYERCTE
jgi:hypothetical protein